MSCPPKKTASSGVINRKCPVTVTDTVWPMAGAAGHGLIEHAIVTSAGVIVTKLPLASLVARHMTRFGSRFAEVQAVFGMNEVGSCATPREPLRGQRR